MSTVLTVTQNRLAAVQKSLQVNGMQLVNSKKDDATGGKASSLQLQKKKAFTDAWKKSHPSATNKEANTAFDQYRVATLKDYNFALGTAILKGELVSDRIRADGNGDIKTAAFVKRDRVNADKIMDSISVVENLMKLFPGKTLEEIAKLAAGGNAKSIDITDVDATEVSATETQPTAPANNAPEHVAAQEPAAS